MQIVPYHQFAAWIKKPPDKSLSADNKVGATVGRLTPDLACAQGKLYGILLKP